MTQSPTLFRYISKTFLVNFMVLMLLLLGIIYIFDLIELIRRASRFGDASFNLLLRMAALKLPEVGQTMLPFGILFSAIYTCWKLNKTHELIVIRAAGLSVWQFLFPMIFSAMMLGVVATTVINPVSSLLLARYAQMEIVHLQGNTTPVTISRTGIWLRQPTEPDGYALIHAENFDRDKWKLGGVTVLYFNNEDAFLRRADGETALLLDKFWEINNVRLSEGSRTTKLAKQELPTDLTAQKIEESFADPETISFWKIPEFITIMEETGFPALRLELHFHSLLARPLFFAAMILLAATFSLRPPRFAGTGLMIGLGVLTGFFIFFMESMLQAFGISQKIPVFLAAWTPAIVCLMLGTTALLHLEDG